MSKSFGIFIRTYHRDAPRLRYLLKSVARFCEGFSKVVIVCPQSSEDKVSAVVSEFSFAELKTCPEYQNDFIGQQITKLRASSYIDTEYIAHVDSDCVFLRPFSPQAYMEDNIPILYNREYDFFYKNKMYMPWQHITSRLMLRQINLEFMALFPIFYPRAIYNDLEGWIFDNHRIRYENIEDLITVKDEFSEFNLLGAYSYYEAHGLYNVHENWGNKSPIHYVKQFCDQGRDIRELSETEELLIEEIIKLDLHP